MIHYVRSWSYTLPQDREMPQEREIKSGKWGVEGSYEYVESGGDWRAGSGEWRVERVDWKV